MKSMDKLFLDTNVVIDFLCERQGFYLPAAKIIVKGYKKEVELWCSSLTFATASYLMGKCHIPASEIFHKLSDFFTICKPASVDSDVVKDALNSSFSDFEDALQYYSAKKCCADIIITRNKKDYSDSELPILFPIEFLNK